MSISRRPFEVHPGAAPGGIVDGRGGDSPPVRYGQCSRNIEMHVKSCLVEAVKFSFLKCEKVGVFMANTSVSLLTLFEDLRWASWFCFVYLTLIKLYHGYR